MQSFLTFFFLFVFPILGIAAVENMDSDNFWCYMGALILVFIIAMACGRPARIRDGY